MRAAALAALTCVLLLFSAACGEVPAASDAAPDERPDAASDAAPQDALDRDAGDGADALPRGDGSLDGAPSACTGARDAGAIAPVLYYHLRAAPFPGTPYPDVAVHVPAGFDGAHRPGMLVFFHGFDNCVTNVMGNVDSPCLPGGPPRTALHLVDQIDAARVNALLVAVEVEVDMQTGVPGALATDGDFRALLHELLVEHLDSVLGCDGLDVDDFERVVLSSHSGGYQAVAAVLTHGRVPAVREVDLLDSLYGNLPTYDGWVRDQAARFDPARADSLRFVDVYTSGGGTYDNSRAMAALARGWLADAGLSSELLDDDTTSTLAPAAYLHAVIFKHSALAHAEVPQYYVQRLAQAAGFAPLP